LRIATGGPGLALAALLLAGCSSNPLMVRRSPCPAVAIPLYVGSYTRFDPPQSRNADAIAFSAQLFDVKGSCLDEAETLTTTVSFKVSAQRRRAGPPMDATVPLFVALVQGGNVLVSKQLTAVQLHFADGQLRTEGVGGARAEVARSATALPPEVQQKIAKKRQADEADALTDPMSDPQVRAALRAASFEVLVGFQLSDADLAYNIAK